MNKEEHVHDKQRERSEAQIEFQKERHRLKPLIGDSLLNASGTGYQLTPEDTKTYLRARL